MLGWVIWAGIVLGATSLGLDELSGPVGDVIRFVGGTAFAWGLAALLAAYLSPNHRAARQWATVLLGTAILVYYGLIVAIGHRWRGATLADGSPAVWVSLASVGRAVLLWLVGAILAGVVLGWLGARIHSASRPTGAIAAGLATGLLGAQAAVLLVQAIGRTPLSPRAVSQLAAAGITVLLAFVVPATMLGRDRNPSWLTYVLTAVCATGLCAVAWSQLEAVRSAL
jgi:uncharacterized membrane protein YeaQ/YmgE (transglycosylase-associated protein family)